MSLDALSRAGDADLFHAELEADDDAGSPLVENVVAATVAAFTVLFVSSIAVLMYLA